MKRGGADLGLQHFSCSCAGATGLQGRQHIMGRGAHRQVPLALGHISGGARARRAAWGGRSWEVAEISRHEKSPGRTGRLFLSWQPRRKQSLSIALCVRRFFLLSFLLPP